ncbi:MAG TPA: metal ABC transporter permease [Candidatus Ozemobacteraceae bacterium]|nr:metal ABC transporter permease [Candidatus Ozemobacteraceae bacterium]
MLTLWFTAAVGGGLGCGLAGFLLGALRMPFLGVTLAHAALAGAVWGTRFGWSPVWSAAAAAIASAVVLGPLADWLEAEDQQLATMLFTVSLGVAFLGLARTEGAPAEAFALLWGSLLLVSWTETALLWIGVGTVLFLLIAGRRLWPLLLLDPATAWLNGLPARPLRYLLILFSAILITLSLHLIGGLMLYSLVSNPLLAAGRRAAGLAQTLCLTLAYAAAASVGGLLLSLWQDWPPGACIVICSAALPMLPSLSLKHRKENVS